jgi:hypothetical protein
MRAAAPFVDESGTRLSSSKKYHRAARWPARDTELVLFVRLVSGISRGRKRRQISRFYLVYLRAICIGISRPAHLSAAQVAPALTLVSSPVRRCEIPSVWQWLLDC